MRREVFLLSRKFTKPSVSSFFVVAIRPVIAPCWARRLDDNWESLGWALVLVLVVKVEAVARSDAAKFLASICSAFVCRKDKDKSKNENKDTAQRTLSLTKVLASTK